jgi:hypothetical protein
MFFLNMDQEVNGLLNIYQSGFGGFGGFWRFYSTTTSILEIEKIMEHLEKSQATWTSGFLVDFLIWLYMYISKEHRYNSGNSVLIREKNKRKREREREREREKEKERERDGFTVNLGVQNAI